MFDGIEFQAMANPDLDELVDFYQRQGHEMEESREKLRRILDATFCCVAARREGTLIGWSRGVINGHRGLLAECKLDASCQGPACVSRYDGRIEHDAEGIAREMARLVIEALRANGAEEIDVLAYGTEVDFCEEMGFRTLRGVVPMVLAAGQSVAETVTASASLTG